MLGAMVFDGVKWSGGPGRSGPRKRDSRDSAGPELSLSTRRYTTAPSTPYIVAAGQSRREQEAVAAAGSILEAT